MDSSLPGVRHIAVIDPAIRTAEVDCFNLLVRLSPGKLTYHLPGLFGTGSLETDPPTGKHLVGAIVLGSATSVYEAPPWQEPLVRWLLTTAARGIPVFGICYGHQLLAHAFGGTVAFRTPDKRKRVGFAEVHLQDSNPESSWNVGSQSGLLFFSHREYVKDAPKDMAVVGRGDEEGCEALAHKKLPIWTTQAHPEATRSFAARQGIVEPEERFSFGYDILRKFFARTERVKT